MPTSLDEVRARAQRHQDELDRNTRFLSAMDLKRRWGCCLQTVRAIPKRDLPYLNLGRGLVRELRRYRPADVEAYEAKRLGKTG
jgi:hypothetical protein